MLHQTDQQPGAHIRGHSRVVVRRYGGTDALELIDAAPLEPGRGEVRELRVLLGSRR